MYSGHRLIELLERQHQDRGQSGLFQKGAFSLPWRAKVGSFPHPDLETIVSAGEPCGAWRAGQNCPPEIRRPEDKRQVGDNWKYFRELPLYGYIPGSGIRGLVRAWAKQRPEINFRMLQLLGYQEDDTISAGKIEFLDAWPVQPTKVTLDIVNPQQKFQVYHEGQGNPLSFYTLGNGQDSITVTVAIRGIPGKATAEEVAEVWEWVRQALTLYGVGSRTASGYGALRAAGSLNPNSDPGYSLKRFDFSLYTQGCAGPDMNTKELRPSHWRGWLRSWVLRFLLGVMSRENAEITVGELLGTLEPASRKGCVRLQMVKSKTWGERSENEPYFYGWRGQLLVSAPEDILNKIILPIIRFAVSVGGVGRGWRRPLHIFHMNNGRKAARGTHLSLTHQVPNKTAGQEKTEKYRLFPNPEIWDNAYQSWLAAVREKWPNRVAQGANRQLAAEVFSPATCAVYAVPGPVQEPVDRQNIRWDETDAQATRGDGMDLIYQDNPPRRYKRNRDLGGDAAGGGNAHCSWASIKRVNVPNKVEDTDCQEIVCLFMGGQTPESNHIRSRFLGDLGKINGAVRLFGVQPPATQT
ncbi:MAG: hypothetical protein KME26_33770 [Oscillatoria princeps RMCB-10]|jgi:CRISPR-associated protein Cmr6|nr:hypothetical protein [Oscillatoria princeps RMCB-10]